MPDLLIKFKLNLEYHPIQSGALYIPHPHGPLFHRWLPDGVADAIELDTNDSKATLRKSGLRDKGMLMTDILGLIRIGRRSLLTSYQQQGKLDAGPLFGLLEIRDISDIEAKSLKERNLYTDVSKNLGEADNPAASGTSQPIPKYSPREIWSILDSGD